MEIRPITPALLVEDLADRLAAERPGRWLRVAVDGPPPAEPDRLAAALVDPLRARGRAAVHVPASGFLRPASLRYEQGRTNPDAFYTDWLDESALRREVLIPLNGGLPGGGASGGGSAGGGSAGGAGPGRILPSLWDPVTDRATRAAYLTVPPAGAVLVSGAFLLGGVLPFDLTIHLAMTPAALARRLARDQHWTLPAYTRYTEEVTPHALADVVIRTDDPRHPALVLPTPRP